MSLTNPVVSDLIVAGYEQDRWAEVERLTVRREQSRADRQGLLVRQRAAIAPRAAKRFCSHALVRAKGAVRILRPAPEAMCRAGDGSASAPS